jgi:hypothetical protein
VREGAGGDVGRFGDLGQWGVERVIMQWVRWMKWRGEWSVGILGVQLLVLELVLLMFSVGGYTGFFFREDINDMDNNFAWIMVVYDVDAGFFGWEVNKDLKR